jgi:hypothetical protein
VRVATPRHQLFRIGATFAFKSRTIIENKEAPVRDLAAARQLCNDFSGFSQYASLMEEAADAERRRAPSLFVDSDGKRLLHPIEVSEAHAQLPKLPSAILLQRVWDEQFVEADDTPTTSPAAIQTLVQRVMSLKGGFDSSAR